MEERVNVAELLKDCPIGMELYSPIYGPGRLTKVTDRIHVKFPKEHNVKCFRPDGKVSEDGEIMLYPEGKTTWEGFVPPCKFKDGDIIADNHKNIAIYKGEMWYNRNLADFYCGYRNYDSRFLDKPKKDKHFGVIKELHFATEEEKQKLFDVIKSNGYKWDADEKKLEKLVEPKFKVGDRVRNKNYKDYIYDIYNVTDKGYRAKEIDADLPIFILFGSQEVNYELVPDKFDINTLVPFESRVLVRSHDTDLWKPSNWGGYNDHYSPNFPYITTYGSVAQCIPYEGNEHLINTTNDCSEHYKTWKKKS